MANISRVSSFSSLSWMSLSDTPSSIELSVLTPSPDSTDTPASPAFSLPWLCTLLKNPAKRGDHDQAILQFLGDPPTEELFDIALQKRSELLEHLLTERNRLSVMP